MFMFGGLFFIGLSLIGKKVRRKFISESLVTTGVVVDIKEERHRTRSHGSATAFFLPIIEYKVKSKLRFIGEIDAVKHKIKIGDHVEVLIGKSNGKIARLKKSNNQMFLLLNMMLFLGVGSCCASVYLFNTNEFSLSFIKDPLTAVIVMVGFVFLSIKAAPIIRLYFDYGPNYTENAYEETDTDA